MDWVDVSGKYELVTHSTAYHELWRAMARAEVHTPASGVDHPVQIHNAERAVDRLRSSSKKRFKH